MQTTAAQVTQNLLWCRESTWTPTIDHKICIACGIQRLSAWYSKKLGPTGLESKCKPCKALYSRQYLRRCRQAWDSKEPITAKICNGCKLTLPADRFSLQFTSKDGYYYKCKDCTNAQKIARNLGRSERRRNQALVFAEGSERICFHCHVEKPWAEFHKDVDSTSGIDSFCKQCRNTSNRVRYSIRKLQVQSDTL